MHCASRRLQLHCAPQCQYMTGAKDDEIKETRLQSLPEWQGHRAGTSVKFAREGAKVVVCDVSPSTIENTVEMCKKEGAQAFGYVVDVRDTKALAQLVTVTVEKWGRIDCLVNNAGTRPDAQ